MSTLILHPKALHPADLDHYLSMGWRPTGQSVYNSNFLRLDNGKIVSVLPLRLPLVDFTFSKSIRKLLSQNLRRFKVVFGPATLPTADFKAVNELYLAEYPNKSLEAIQYHVIGNRLRRVLDTWQTSIYDGDKLVAFSYFDLGDRTAYSKCGIYDPSYARYSLGIFSMALEVQMCQRMRKELFYPGYVSDDDPMFDYKHRLGAMDFYDLHSRSWKVYGENEAIQSPLAINQKRLERVQSILQKVGIKAALFAYPYLDMRYSIEGPSKYLDAPLLLHLEQEGEYLHRILIYENEHDVYRELKAIVPAFVVMRRVGSSGDGPTYFSDPLRTGEQLQVAGPAEDIVAGILRREA